jgi:hypothetical protein
MNSNQRKYILAGNCAGRRASDGNANLHIFYQTSSNTSQMGNDEIMMMTNQHILSNACHQLKAIDANMESSGEDSSNDEIQRYMHGRGSNKRHTVGCTDDYDLSSTDPPLAHSPIPSTSNQGGGGGGGVSSGVASSSGGRTR